MYLRKSMRMRWLAACLYLAVAVSHANQIAAPSVTNAESSSASAPVVAIPYKQEPKSFAEQSVSTFLLTLAVLAVTVAGLYAFRNYLQKKTGRTFIKTSAINVKERIRVNSKLSMYVVAYRDKEILVAQSGDAVTPLSEYPIDSHPPHSQSNTPQGQS
jgi:flagellar biogenesis protein FliO